MAETTTRTATGRTRPAVVIGLDCITGLQTSRILADRGVPVVGVVADRRHWGAHTRACVEVVESPLRGEQLVSTLRSLGPRLDAPAVLFPCTDPSVDTVSRHRDLLEDHFVLPLAPHPTVTMLMDKVSFAAHASSAGHPVPRTEVLTCREDAELVAGSIAYPCVLKPPGKSASWLARTSAKGFAVRDAEQLMELYDRVHGWAQALLLQEWVEGAESQLLSCNAYFGEGGRPLATFVARKIRQWPPDIGTSASGEECRDDEALDHTVRLFGGLGFRGLAYLELKRDARTGRLMLIEANVGRPTGRSAIAEAGGVELVHTAYCDALGLPLPQNREQRYVGAKWLDLRRDAQAATVARRRGTLTMTEWLRWVRGPKAHAIWSPRDPKPFVVDLVQASATGIRAVARARGTRGAAADGAVKRAEPARLGGSQV
ncbi:MAG TPA: hypothetical protein VFZ64_10890 [Nocardioidaceae bacterium]